jgi:transposase
MMIIGCDFHPGFQQIAYVEQETGEYGERRLGHRGEALAFYRSLADRAVRIGVEATGNDRWFRKLISELGHELLVGTPARFMLRLRASGGRTSGTPATFCDCL